MQDWMHIQEMQVHETKQKMWPWLQMYQLQKPS